MKNNTQQTQSIVKFIQSLGEKNYAQADKHLQQTIENKLLSRISAQKNINIFKT